MNKQYEYLIMSLINDKKNNELFFRLANKKFNYELKNAIFEFLGSEGWELVSPVVLSSKVIEYLFKRELEEIKELSEDALKIKNVLGKVKSEKVTAETEAVDLVQKSKDI